jgi:hypothetical protein
VIVAEVLLATAKVVIVNVADVLPEGTATEVGTVAAAVLLLCRATLTPPVGAGPVRVTVPVEDPPPLTLVGLTVTDVRLTGGVVTVGVTVSVALWFEPKEPVMITAVLALTALVLMEKVALVFPAVITTLAGVCAAAVLLLDSATAAPPLGAGPLRVTVPVAPVPPTTLVGLTEIDERTTAGDPP